MPKQADQKARILKTLELLEKKTDDRHMLTVSQIMEHLETEGIDVNRKTVMDDIHVLEDFGYDIGVLAARGGGYYLASREFELAELKLLIDAVQSCKFITERKSSKLIAKIAKLTSDYEGGTLERQVYVSGRTQKENSNILYAVDAIHTAIAEKKSISFYYNEWTLDKVLKPRHNGMRYQVSPYLLTFSDGYYYLVGYSKLAEGIRHYRVDKMSRVTVQAENRIGEEFFRHFDPAKYTSETFSMFGGVEERVTMQCDNSLIGSVIDQFGDGILILNREERTFKFSTRVRVSPTFYAWVLGFGGRIQILSPEYVCDGILDLCNNYLEKINSKKGE